MSDQIHLLEARVPCRVGVPAEERAHPQELVLDVSLRTDLRAAAYSEKIEETVDYSQVLDLVHFVAGAREWVLIESLAEAICGAILRQFPVASVRLLLRKPEALYARGVVAAAVEMERFQPKGQRATTSATPGDSA
ncbi:MAG: dihydroneopterin aldolase [Bryobacterales bacterium]|nr:dihydroneopterin aldolase [Bryobacterales bacterium]